MTTELETVVDRLVDELVLPGAAVAVIGPGQVAQVCRGLADVATGRRVHATTQFRIGSITKTMTTLLVLQLVEQRRVGLDDPVSRHVPVRIRQPGGARAITIRDLLTHTSGLGEIACWSALRHPLWAVGACRPDRSPPSLVALAQAGYRAEAAPGHKWVYANPGFTLLGRLVEEVVGRPFADALAEGVFERVGMGDTTLDPAQATDLAIAYKHRDGAFEALRPFGVATVSAGGVITTLTDLVSYARMLLDHGSASNGRVVDPDLLAEAFRVQFQPGTALKGIGLTFRIRNRGEMTLIGHNGSMPGWNAGLVLCPAQGVAAVALVNRAVSPSAEFGGGRLAQAALDTVLDAGSARSHTRRAQDEPTDLDDFVGRYRPAPGVLTNVRAYALFGGAIRIGRDGDGLLLRGVAGPLRGPHPLRPDANHARTFHLDLRGVDLPLTFDAPRDRRCPHLWLDGIPTGFSLYRTAQPMDRHRRTAAIAGAIGCLIAIGALIARRRGRRPTLCDRDGPTPPGQSRPTTRRAGGTAPGRRR